MKRKTWFYLSFADADRFLGACVVEAESAKEAPRVASAHGINPGGEVLIIPSPDGGPGPHPTYRLLSRSELGDGTASMGELRERGIVPPDDVLVVTDPRTVN
jgi:hypothetical protein